MTDTVTRTEVQAGIAAGTLVLVDALGESYYASQHLPGARNLAPEEVDARAAALLPDKGADIVTYCAGPSCPNSEHVAKRLLALGYRHVRTYPGGIADWAEAGLPVETGVPATT